MATPAPFLVKVWLYTEGDGKMLFDEDTFYIVYSEKQLRKADVVAALTLDKSKEWEPFSYKYLILPVTGVDQYESTMGYYVIETQEHFEEICRLFYDQRKDVTIGVVIGCITKKG